MALSSIAVEQMNAMEKNNGPIHPIIGLPLMPLECEGPISCIGHGHLGVLYLSEAKACRRAWGHFFMGWMPENGVPIHMNGAFHVSTTILRFVVTSAAKAELGTLYHNCQTGIIF